MWPHIQQPTRLPHPWDSPGKNTGVGCHFLPQCSEVKSESEVAQSCLTLSDPMDCSLPGSSVHGSFQARVLEWGAIAFSQVHSNHLLFSLSFFFWLCCVAGQEYWNGVPLPSLKFTLITYYFSLSLFFFFLTVLHDLQDLSSPTRDWIQATAAKAQNSKH